MATEPPHRAQTFCHVCGAAPPEGQKIKTCGRCRVTSYCSVECQKSDWLFGAGSEQGSCHGTSHKDVCLPYEERAQFINLKKYFRKHDSAIFDLVAKQISSIHELKDRYFIVPVLAMYQPPRVCINVPFDSRPSLAPLPSAVSGSKLYLLDQGHEQVVSLFRRSPPGAHILVLDVEARDGSIYYELSTLHVGTAAC